MTSADHIVAEGITLVPTAGPMGPAGPKGDTGEPGEPGPTSGGPAHFSGQGAPPEVLEGAKPGDTWLDTTTGIIYTLTADSTQII